MLVFGPEMVRNAADEGSIVSAGGYPGDYRRAGTGRSDGAVLLVRRPGCRECGVLKGKEVEADPLENSGGLHVLAISAAPSIDNSIALGRYVMIRVWIVLCVRIGCCCDRCLGVFEVHSLAKDKPARDWRKLSVAWFHEVELRWRPRL